MEMENEQQLPEGWRVVTLKDVGKIETGTTPAKSNSEYYGSVYPFFKPTDLEAGINTWIARDNLSEEGIKRSRFLKAGSVLVTCIGATIGKTGRIKRDGACNQQINAIIPNGDVLSEYVYYQITSSGFQKSIKDNASSTTLPILNKSKFEKLAFVLAPLDQQQQIVSKLEELFSELDKSVEGLKLAQQQLKLYRQSVLQWAFEGKLTNEDVKEGELPEGWSWIALDSCIDGIEAGKSFRCDERTPREDQVGILKVSAVTWGEFDGNESKTVLSESQVNENYLVKPGDFLFSRANTIELVGAAVIVKNVKRKLMLSDKTLRIIWNDSVHKYYVLYYLRCKKGRTEIERLSTGNQESMRNIGQNRIKQIQLPYCEIEEQTSIVQEIDARLSAADKLEENISQSLLQAEAMRQAILKQAFQGELDHYVY